MMTFDERVPFMANYFIYDNPNVFLNKLKNMKPTELKIFSILTFLGKHQKTQDKDNEYSHAGTVTISLNELITSATSFGISQQTAKSAINSLIKNELITIGVSIS